MKGSRWISFLVLFLVPVFLFFPQQARQLKTVRPAQLSAVKPWADWCDKAMKATAEAVEIWGNQAKIVNGIVNAPNAFAGPGCLSSPGIQNHIKNFLISKQVPGKIAAGFADGIAAQWGKWQSKVMIPNLPIFPMLLNWPGPSAPPTPGIPMSLSSFTSSGLSQISGPKLSNSIIKALGKEATPDSYKHLERFSDEFASRFHIWIVKVQVVNLMGHGPVPTYVPLYHPTGPVVNGSILPAPGILSDFRF